MLTITASQASEVVTPTDANISQAFLNGVISGSTAILDAIPQFNTLSSAQQAQVRDIYDLWVAALIKTLNLQHVFANPVPGTVVIPLVKLTGPGTNGSLTFTNGLLVAYVAPT